MHNEFELDQLQPPHDLQIPRTIDYSQRFQREQVYTKLAEANEQNQEPINLFAVIIDAQKPYLNNGKYMMNIKVVDESLNQLVTENIRFGSGDSRSISHANLTFFASNFEALPCLCKIGDIIRVTKAKCKFFNKQKQLNTNIHEHKGEWAIYRGTMNSPVLQGPSISMQHADEEQTELENADQYYERQFYNPSRMTMADLSKEEFTYLRGGDGSDQKKAIRCLEEMYNLPFYYTQFERKGFSYHETERELLANLRRWAEDHFQQIYVHEPEVFVPTFPRISREGQSYYRNFDLIGKVIKTCISEISSFNEDNEPETRINFIIQDANGARYFGTLKQDAFATYAISEVDLSDSKVERMSQTEYSMLVIKRVLSLGNIVRIRDAKLSTTDNHFDPDKQRLVATRNHLDPEGPKVFYLDMYSEFIKYSNILVVPDHFLVSKYITARVVEDQVFSKLVQTKRHVLRNKRIVSRVSNQRAKDEFISMKDILEEEAYRNQHYFRVLLQVIELVPKDLRMMTRPYCPICKSYMTYKPLEEAGATQMDGVDEAFLCSQCQGLCQPEYFISFLVKDERSLLASRPYRVILKTETKSIEAIDDQHLDQATAKARQEDIETKARADPQRVEYIFGGHPPSNLFKDETSLKRIQAYVNMLLQPSVFIDCVVSRVRLPNSQEQLLEISDCQLHRLPLCVEKKF